MIVIGELALWLTLVYAVWGAVASSIGAAAERPSLVASGVRGLWASGIMSLLAIAGVVSALVRRDYELAFAAAHTSHSLPLPYAVAALVTAPAGAVLLFATPIAIAGAFAAGVRASRVTPWMVALLSVAVLACVAPLCFSNALFARLSSVPADGAGLAPRLQTPFLLVQPPLALLGYGLLVPHLARELGALLARAEDDGLRRATHRIAVLGWVLLGIAILVALRWALHDPEWWTGWLRRPLVDGSLIAWLLSGVSLATTRVDRRSHRLGAVATVVASAAVIVAVGLAPLGLIAEWSDDARVRAGAALLATTIALAVVAWRAGGGPATVAPRRRRSVRERIGLGLVSAGLVASVGALVARGSHAEQRATLETGRAVTLRDPRGHDWRLTGQGVSIFQSLNRDVSALAVAVSRGAGREGLLTAERWQVLDRDGHATGEPVATAGVYSTLGMELRVLLDASSADAASVRVAFEPFARLIWIGGALLLLGGVLALVEVR